jgi:hypothetical protein
MENIAYHSIESLALELHLPQGYLRKLAAENKIPFLVVGGRKRFNPKAVQIALDNFSQQGGCNGK